MLGFCEKSYADTFIVTSNADSGPGTLREAITLANANGTGVTDYINFNIAEPVFRLRIIRITSELPALSSNIVIDGTTQPGGFYATTDAKICLIMNEYAPEFSMIKIVNARNVKIYGLYLYYNYWRGLFAGPANNGFRSSYLYGINLINSFDIEIGSPGKGNVINGAVHGIFSNSDSCRNVAIRSNYIGLGAYYRDFTTDNDIDTVILHVESAITLYNVKDIAIGGVSAAEANTLSGSRAIDIDSKYSTDNGFLTIQHNFVGYWFDRQEVLYFGDFWNYHINIGRSRNNGNYSLDHPIDFKVTIADNDIASHLRLDHLSTPFFIVRNKFNHDVRTDSYPFKCFIGMCSGGWLGTDNPSEANTFLTKRSEYRWSVGIVSGGPIKIIKNIFSCNSTWGSTTLINKYYEAPPFVQVDQTTASSVSGRATPNARVDLYYDDGCSACEGEQFIATVSANTAGQWTYNGSITGVVVAIAIKDGYSSEFSAPQFDLSKMVVTQPTCGLENGSIKGIIPEGADSYFWLNYVTMDTVSHELDLKNVGPGHYILLGKHGATCVNSINQTISLEDHTPKIILNSTYITNSSCGRATGSIQGLIVNNSANATMEWKNSQFQVIGQDRDIFNLLPGKYYFIVKDITVGGGCADTTEFDLVNQSGPSLILDNLSINAATCSNANGSITNLSTTNVTGAPLIQWLDSLNNPIGNSLDLLNVPAGKYTLKFKDESGCDTIITPYYTIGSIGVITIDTIGKLISPSSCTVSTGAIENIKVTGATGYQWRNTATNNIVGNSLLLSGVAPGNYQLTATNNTGCSAVSPVINVPPASFNPINVTQFYSADAICGEPNGMIVITHFNKNEDDYTFEWIIKSNGQSIGSGTTILGLQGGDYGLLATDENGCKQEVFSITLKAFPTPSYDLSSVRITDDKCSLSQGSVTGIKINDLPPENRNYRWFNNNGAIISNSPSLENVGAGQYNLTVSGGGCSMGYVSFTVNNNDNAGIIPQYDNLTIPRFTAATLTVKNPQSGTYYLYSDAAGTQLLQQNNTGVFTTTSLPANTDFYVKHVTGTCSSALTNIKVTVVDKSYFAIPSAFTPNSDGKNDQLNLKVIGYIDVDYFKIYNRNGEEVFSTKVVNNGWNGIYRGSPQPSSVFVWVAKGKDLLGNVIEQKGTFVLIR